MLALPATVTASCAFEFTCITHFGARTLMEPLPLTCTAAEAVRLSASRQYCAPGEVGATMAVLLARMGMVRTPMIPMKSVVTVPVAVPVKLASAFRRNDEDASVTPLA